MSPYLLQVYLLEVAREFLRAKGKPLPFFRKKKPNAANRTILDGAYRLHLPEDLERFTRCVAEVFPLKWNRFHCFGADWMGRQFALDQERIKEGEPEVALLDPVTAEIFEIPCGYREFHEVELVQYPNETMEYDQYKRWLDSGGQPPSYGECVGHKVPLCLGGKDTHDNLEISDLEVYWSLSGQLQAQLRDHSTGTTIGRVKISDE